MKNQKRRHAVAALCAAAVGWALIACNMGGGDPGGGGG
jgi:hypothetical protein